MPRGTDYTPARPNGAHVDQAESACIHVTTTVVFKRSGTRLHPNVWMEERCIDCDQEIDRKRVSRGMTDSYAKRSD